jgi:Ni/Co efflux regulator RcnB
MKKSLIAMTSALLLAGVSFAASAQSTGYYDSYGRYHQGVSDDRYDSRDDSRYDSRDYPRYDTQDLDRDGVNDRYDRYDDRANVSWDRDRDGMNDRYENQRDRRDGYYGDNDRRGYGDRDRDGVPNRYDRNDNRRYAAHRRYQAGRYNAPRNYRYVRYNVGSRLPMGYYGNSYYIDYRPYGLMAPPRGYRWNRVGSDAYLVSITNGVVRDVIYSLFY